MGKQGMDEQNVNLEQKELKEEELNEVNGGGILDPLILMDANDGLKSNDFPVGTIVKEKTASSPKIGIVVVVLSSELVKVEWSGLPYQSMALVKDLVKLGKIK